MSEDWIKFHRDLTRGKWMPCSRATRFVLMELSLLCKPGEGKCELPPATKRSPEPVSRCADMLGGNRAEAKRAIQKLATDGDDDSPPTALFLDAFGARVDPVSPSSSRLVLIVPGYLRRNSRSKSAERMAKKRESARLAESVTSQPETCARNGDALEKSREDQSREDPPTPPTPKRKRRAPALPLPADWEPGSEHVARCREHGLDLDLEVTKFRSHAEANDRRQARWGASFTTWLANAVGYQRERGGAPQLTIPGKVTSKAAMLEMTKNT